MFSVESLYAVIEVKSCWPEPDTAVAWVSIKCALQFLFLFMMGQLPQAIMRPVQVKDYISETLTYGSGELMTE